MDYTRTNFATRATTNVNEGLRSYMLAVYNYMAAALAITGVCAFGVASSPALMQLIFGTPLAYLVMFAPLLMIIFVMPRISHMSVSNAQITFWSFAAIMGLSLASIFVMYTSMSIARVFFITASVFGAISLYGYTTKKDLSN